MKKEIRFYKAIYYLNLISGFFIFCFFSALFYLSIKHAPLAEVTIVLSLFVTIFLSAIYNPVSCQSYNILNRGLALLAFTYILLQYPAFPVIHERVFSSYIFVYWVSALLFCVAGFFRPSFLLYPGCYLILIKVYAGHLTGFTYERTLDIIPFYQTIILIGAITLSEHLYTLARGILNRFLPNLFSSHADVDKSQRVSYYNFAVFLVIALHAAGYLFSGIEKISLNGGPSSWLLQNDLKNIFLTASTNGQLFWQHFDFFHQNLLRWWSIDASLLAAFFVLAVQLAAAIIFIKKRFAIVLFILIDLLHFGILILVGANFVTWMILNVIFASALLTLPSTFFGIRPVIASVIIMIIAQFVFSKFYRVPNLAWYDTRAVNTMYLEALDENGIGVRLPSQFFLFYSYPISHMSFGLPKTGGDYLPTRTNGGSRDMDTMLRSYACDFDGHYKDTQYKQFEPESFDNFITGYHEWYKNEIGNKFHRISSLYWHHFWSSKEIVDGAVRDIDLSKINSYRLVIQPICVEPDDGDINLNLLKPIYRSINLPPKFLD